MSEPNSGISTVEAPVPSKERSFEPLSIVLASSTLGLKSITSLNSYVVPVVSEE